MKEARIRPGVILGDCFSQPLSSPRRSSGVVSVCVTPLIFTRPAGDAQKRRRHKTHAPGQYQTKNEPNDHVQSLTVCTPKPGALYTPIPCTMRFLLTSTPPVHDILSSETLLPLRILSPPFPDSFDHPNRRLALSSHITAFPRSFNRKVRRKVKSHNPRAY
jgi:hypothetical protein